MRSKRRDMWIAVTISVVTFGTITSLVVYSIGHHRKSAGTPIAAALRGDTLILIDHLPADEREDKRTTLVSLGTGEVLERALDDAPSSYFSGPEQFCATTRELGETSRLIVPPYPGQIGAPHHAEAPSGTIMIAPHTGALGFLVDPKTRSPLRLAADVLYLHMYSFDASVRRGRPESWISRLGPDGEPRWSRRLAGGCQLAALRGDLLVLATKAGDGRAIALDVASGEPRWQLAR